MNKMSYVKFDIPDKLKDKILNSVGKIAEARGSKIRKGMNEVTKSIERKTAKLVVMAEDVSPPEILFHIPLLCDEKNVPYAYVNTKKELGNAVRINVSTSAAAIEAPGSGNDKDLQELVNQVKQLK
jgi:ribosomal protein eL8